MKAPITVMQSYFWDCQVKSPKSTGLNLYKFLKMDPAIDAQRLADAITQSIRSQESLQTVLYIDENGNRMQEYRPDLTKNVLVEKITEAELEKIKHTILKPFVLIGSPLYDMRVFQTELTSYMYLNVHHIIFDGWSWMLLQKYLQIAYKGQKIRESNYYEMLAEQQKETESSLYNEAKRYFDHIYGNLLGYEHKLKQDEYIASGNKRSFITQVLPFSQKEVRDYEHKYKIDSNVFYITAAAKAMAEYNKNDKIYFSWLYHGRSNRKYMKSTGLYIKENFVKFDFNQHKDIEDIYKDVKEQIELGIKNSSYPYSLISEIYKNEDFPCVIYKGDMVELSTFCDTAMEEIEIDNLTDEPENIMDIHITNDNMGKVYFVTDCDLSVYREKSILKFHEIFKQSAKRLLEIG